MNIELVKQVESLLNEKDKLAALANVTAAINQTLHNINWVGFYLYKNDELVLGPFQGKVACTHIKIGNGVCGTAYSKKILLNIPDVHQFEGHIACDEESNSEIVIPLIYFNKIFGVLDIDSPVYRRFSSDDEETLQEIANLVSKRMAL